MKNIHQINDNIYITNDEEIKEGDWMYYKHFGEDIVCKYDTMNGQNTNVNEHKPFYQKIILTTDQDLIKDGVQAIDDEFLQWFVKNPSCESVEVDKNWNYPLDKSWEYKLRIIPKDEAKERAKNYMSLKGALETKQIKCYCGHTSYCDCSPLDEDKKTSVNWLIETLESDIKVDESNMVTIRIHEHDYIKSKQVALEMNKNQIMNSWVSGVTSEGNMTAEQYFNETYKNK
jgi:hypothetical protein